MNRWSKLVGLCALGAVSSAFAQGHLPVGGIGGLARTAGVERPSVGPGTVPNPGQLLPSQPVGPGVVPNPGQLPVQPFAGGPEAAKSRLARIERRGGREFGGGGFGGAVIGDNLGFTTLGGNVSPDDAPYDGPEEGALPPPTVISGIGPRQCIAPQIIRIGRGIDRPRRTRVVYGTPGACVYP